MMILKEKEWERVENGSKVWEWEVGKSQVKKCYVPGHNLGEPTKVFEVQQGTLSRTALANPPENVALPRTAKRAGNQLHHVAKLSDEIAITEAYTWKDGRGLFDTSSSHLRPLLLCMLEF